MRVYIANDCTVHNCYEYLVSATAEKLCCVLYSISQRILITHLVTIELPKGGCIGFTSFTN